MATSLNCMRAITLFLAKRLAKAMSALIATPACAGVAAVAAVAAARAAAAAAAAAAVAHVGRPALALSHMHGHPLLGTS